MKPIERPATRQSVCESFEPMIAKAKSSAPVSVLLLGPALQAVSGVSTHLNQLLRSSLTSEFELSHFQIGSEGRPKENRYQLVARLLHSLFAFARFCLRHKPDVVHLNTSLEPKSYWRDIAYLAIAKLLRLKVVYQVHGGALPQDMFPGCAACRWLLNRVLRASDVVVLLAQVEEQAYRAFVPAVPLEVIANAIDAQALVRDPLTAKPQGPLQLAYVGRIAGNKGIFEVVAALGLLSREGRLVHLTVAGSGPDEEQLRSTISELGLDGRVTFAGPLYGEAKDTLWRSAHVFTFPTYHREGLPYALLEAMAAGAVPVTTRVGAIPDVLSDGVHGLFVDAMQPAKLADALRRLDDDRTLLVRLADAGRSRVLLDYTVARLAEDFRRVYLRLADRG
jgi:glycosyltransferase involved in cell wall biosynthesis